MTRYGALERDVHRVIERCDARPIGPLSVRGTFTRNSWWLCIGAAASVSLAGCAGTMRILPSELVMVAVHNERYLLIPMKEASEPKGSEADGAKREDSGARFPESPDWASISQPLDSLLDAAQQLRADSARLILVAPVTLQDERAARLAVRRLKEAGLPATYSRQDGTGSIHPGPGGP